MPRAAWWLTVALLVPACHRFDDEPGWWCRLDWRGWAADGSSCTVSWFCEHVAAGDHVSGDRVAAGLLVEYSVWCDAGQGCHCEENRQPTGTFPMGSFCADLDLELWDTLRGARGDCGFAPLADP